MTLRLRLVVRCILGSLFLLPPGGVSATQSTASEQAPATTATTSKSAQTDPDAPNQSPSDDALSQAQALYRKGDFDGALQKYQQTLQSQPKSSDAYVGLTRVYLKKKDVQLASDTINKAVPIADSPALHVVLGEIYFRQGKLHEAEN